LAKRIFIAFAIEDKWARDYIVGQSKNDKCTFEFVDMSVKEPWDDNWKTRCRTKVKGCDGAIAMVSKNTAKADGALWEIKCAKDESVPIRGVYTTQDNRPATLPIELQGVRVLNWTWDNIKNFIESL
jgi:hypothetical protein